MSAIQTLQERIEYIDKAITRSREQIAGRTNEIANLEADVALLCRAKADHLAAIETLEDGT